MPDWESLDIASPHIMTCRSLWVVPPSVEDLDQLIEDLETETSGVLHSWSTRDLQGQLAFDLNVASGLGVEADAVFEILKNNAEILQKSFPEITIFLETTMFDEVNDRVISEDMTRLFQ